MDQSTQRLRELLAVQQGALRAGDPGAISEATVPLVAHLLQEFANLRLLQGRAPQALELYRKSLQMRDSMDVELEFASALLRTGHAQDAAQEAGAVLQKDSHNASAWAVRGSALRSIGDNKGAADAFSHALEINQDVNVAYALASTLLAQREKEKADRIFQQIIAASGNAAIWHVAAGDAYREALYLNDAAEEFKKAIAIDPKVGHAEFFLGLTYLQMNEWGPSSQSFEHLRTAVRLAPHDYLSNFYLGALESTDGSDLASSDRHLHVAAEADPRSPEVWLYLGLNASREKDTAAAKLYLRKAIDLTGTDEARNNYQIRRVYAVLGRILLSEGNRTEGDALLAKYKLTEQRSIGNSADAISQAGEASAIRSTLPVLAGSEIASAALKPAELVPAQTSIASHHTPEETKQMAATEQQIGGLLAGSLNDLGTAEARQGRYAAALAHFQEAEGWHTPDPLLLRNLGAAAFRVGDFKESARSLALYLKTVASGPPKSGQDERSSMMLAMSLFSLGQFAEADKAFSTISSVALQDPRAAYSWGYSLAHSGQQQHANQIADALVQQELPPDVLSLVCHLYMDTEDYQQSVACFRKASLATPDLKLAHYQIAESLIRLDRPAEAVPELKKEIALSPDNPDVQYSLAFALLQSSQKNEAIAVLKALTTSHPDHAQAQYQLGKALLEDGETAQAVQHLEAAELNNSEPDYIHYQLQAAYRKAGRVADADRELRVYSEIKRGKRQLAPSSP